VTSQGYIAAAKVQPSTGQLIEKKCKKKNMFGAGNKRTKNDNNHVL